MDKLITLNIDNQNKYFINFGLIIFIVGTISLLVTLRMTIYKDDEKYKKYFMGVYYDFVKYLLIEGFLITLEIINKGSFLLVNSLARVAVIQAALLVFSGIKGPLGLHSE